MLCRVIKYPTKTMIISTVVSKDYNTISINITIAVSSHITSTSQSVIKHYNIHVSNTISTMSTDFVSTVLSVNTANGTVSANITCNVC